MSFISSPHNIMKIISTKAVMIISSTNGTNVTQAFRMAGKKPLKLYTIIGKSHIIAQSVYMKSTISTGTPYTPHISTDTHKSFTHLYY